MAGKETSYTTLFVRRWTGRKSATLCVKKWIGRKESHIVHKEGEWKAKKQATLFVRRWNGGKVEWKERKPRCV